MFAFANAQNSAKNLPFDASKQLKMPRNESHSQMFKNSSWQIALGDFVTPDNPFFRFCKSSKVFS